MVKHIFPGVALPIPVHVLRIAGAVHEDHRGPALLIVRRLVAASGDHHSIPRGDLDDRRVEPWIIPELAGRRRCDLLPGGSRTVLRDKQFGWLVRVRIDVGYPLLVGRQHRSMIARLTGDPRAGAAIDAHRVEMALAVTGFAGGKEEMSAVL